VPLKIAKRSGPLMLSSHTDVHGEREKRKSKKLTIGEGRLTIWGSSMRQ
jgi:hypothetical protein